MKKLFWFILFNLSFISLIFCETNNGGTIAGKIYNEKNNEPIPFASIIIWGTTVGTVSDANGNFIFTDVEPGYTRLRVSSIGFSEYLSESFLVTKTNKTYIEIQLIENEIELEAVIVKASLFRKNDESPLSLQRIGIEQIEKNPGGNRDISKVIQSLPGVASQSTYRNDVIVRGGGPNENSFYLDGIEIPNINHFATQGASGGPIGIINADFIREINFYSGAFPVNMSNSLSSVIDMRQIDGNPEKMEFKGAIGSSDLALTLNGSIGKKTTYIVSARRSYLQFLFQVLELPFLPTYNDYQIKTRIRLNKKNEITFISLGSLDQFELNKAANETVEQKYLLSTLPVNEQWSYTIGGIYKHYHSKGYESLVLSRNYLYNVTYKYPENDNTKTKSLDYNSSEIENKIRYERNLNYSNNFKIIYGFGGTYARYLNKTSKAIYYNNQLNYVGYSSAIDMFHYALFVNSTKHLLQQRISLSLGLRADGSTYSKKMNNLLKQASPRLSASYKLNKSLSLNASAGIYYQRPPYTAMGYKDTAGILINKNYGIGYIQSNQFVLGLEYQPNQQSIISAETFYKYYDHYPFSVTDSVPLSTKGAEYGTFGDEEVQPISKGRAYGFEILGRSIDVFNFNLILSYTFVRSEFIDLRSNYYGQYIPSSWDNRHLLNLTATRTFKNNWYLGFKWRFVGKTPYTPYDYEKSSIKEAWDAKGGAYLDYSKFNEKRFYPFHQLDLRIDKEFFFNNWSLNIYLDIQNVYNFKSDEQDLLIRKSFSDPDYNDIYIDQNGIERYELVEIPSSGSGSILPSIGIIIEL